ncbi:hypothetical protein IWX91DRAFT_333581 [Phyllosticta citricarpa]
MATPCLAFIPRAILTFAPGHVNSESNVPFRPALQYSCILRGSKAGRRLPPPTPLRHRRRLHPCPRMMGYSGCGMDGRKLWSLMWWEVP